jgi:hypothetical protein
MSSWQTEMKEYADKIVTAFSEKKAKNKTEEGKTEEGKTEDLKESYATKAELSEYVKRDEVKNMFSEFTESITKSIKE